MSVEFMLAWWNLLFIVPFLLALLYLAVYAVSGMTFGEGEMEFAGDLHADIDHDLDGGLDHDADGDLDHDAETDTAVAPASGGGATDAISPALPLHLNALSWLGLGRVPLSILLMVLLITWGVIGFITNVMLVPLMAWPWMAVLGSLPAAAIWQRGALPASWCRLLVGRWMPTMETYARRTKELVGTAGEAMYDINQQFGLASVRDSGGELFQVPCRVYPDDKPIALRALQKCCWSITTTINNGFSLRRTDVLQCSSPHN